LPLPSSEAIVALMPNQITPEIEPASLRPGSQHNLRGRKCMICSLPLKAREPIDELLRRGDKVASVIAWSANQFKAEGVDKIPMGSFYEHRKRHIQLVDRAANKLSDGQRMQHKSVKLARAVIAGETVDPIQYFGPQQIAEDLKKTSDRLHTAADDALLEKQHSSLASLSSALIRATEVRGKMGGSIAEKTEFNVNLSIQDLHQRLDGLLANPADNRQDAARALLGLAPPPPAESPVFMPDTSTDDPLTIDAETDQSEPK
jgi:hypothetical protein